MSSNAVHEHLPDDVLVRIIDADPAPGEDAAAALAECGQCRARAEQLRHRSARLRGLLAAADWPVPDAGPARTLAERAHARGHARRARRSRARFAAAAVLLLAAGLTVTPAGAWVARAAADLWTAVRGGPSVSAPPEADGAPAETQRTVEFAAAPGELAVHFAATGSGSVTLEAVAGDRLVIEVTGVGTPDVLLLERTVRIDNRDAPAAAYRIRVPPQVTAVRVQIGDAAPAVYRRAELTTSGAQARPLR